ncbi:hypothetical protein SynWH8101_0301 [Synechococcus sp. WH 8101]|uniref:SIMPL domain-containing protein n=1 Tax=Synechococcus sp. WH 8101 TaxID=59932 RepID=UPI00102481A0|nr:SIMPL domain-containing protein [Synechococcus sp. WH 8101]QBE67913.1 hypothetical protein SynWH8101_0301 [Synechococcus sp. WH 8101]
MPPRSPLSVVPRLRLSGFAALSLLPVVALLPLKVQAQVRPAACAGTVLELRVLERGQTRTDRFRFALRLEAEGATTAAALDQLNQRLDATRKALQGLAQGPLTIPAPRTYASGGASQGPRRRQASTSISGEVERGSYDQLIQVAGRLPGVRLQGITSLASTQNQNALADQLLQSALKQGREQAERTAAALGLRRVALLRIDQRGSGTVRPLAFAANAGRQFRPEEAPQPSQSLELNLDYCLS